jgi:FMN phosphatase YigB (HAD superfamily)
VGFDLDGTLYDEFDFIDQVYVAIVTANINLISDKLAAVNWMEQRWLEKGSSYNLIFDEAYDRFGKEVRFKDLFIENSLHIYHSFTPKLELSKRAQLTLEALKNNYRLFLVTDGNAALQRRKFKSLGLDSWFLEKDCIFTGDYGEDGYKPSIKALGQFFEESKPSNCVFFGDRDIDQEFSKAAGMSFVRMLNMGAFK